MPEPVLPEDIPLEDWPPEDMPPPDAAPALLPEESPGDDMEPPFDAPEGDPLVESPPVGDEGCACEELSVAWATAPAAIPMLKPMLKLKPIVALMSFRIVNLHRFPSV